MAPQPQVEEAHSRRGDEPGTAPGDRQFRPDIQGLRAVAVLPRGLLPRRTPRDQRRLHRCGRLLRDLGVRHHRSVAEGTTVGGGTSPGALLRASQPTDRPRGHGRHHRDRLLSPTPSGSVSSWARTTATDASGRRLFLANFHFASIGTNYLTAQLPPSPLQNFWSLAVEEQFYLVYPTMFLHLVAIRSRWSLRARLFAGLLPVVLILLRALRGRTRRVEPDRCVLLPVHPAWELAIGALVAVATRVAAEDPEGRQCRHHLGRARRHRLRCSRVPRHHRVSGIVGRRCRSWGRHWSLPEGRTLRGGPPSLSSGSAPSSGSGSSLIRSTCGIGRF